MAVLHVETVSTITNEEYACFVVEALNCKYIDKPVKFEGVENGSGGYSINVHTYNGKSVSMRMYKQVAHFIREARWYHAAMDIIVSDKKRNER